MWLRTEKLIRMSLNSTLAMWQSWECWDFIKAEIMCIPLGFQVDWFIYSFSFSFLSISLLFFIFLLRLFFTLSSIITVEIFNWASMLFVHTTFVPSHSSPHFLLLLWEGNGERALFYRIEKCFKKQGLNFRWLTCLPWNLFLKLLHSIWKIKNILKRTRRKFKTILLQKLFIPFPANSWRTNKKKHASRRSLS